MPWGSWITCEETVNGPGRRPGLHRRLQRRAAEAARLHLRGAGRRTERPRSRSPGAGRFAHEAVSFDPVDGIALPHRGQLRVPLGLLPLPPAAQPDADRQARQRRPAADARREGPAEHPPRGSTSGCGRRTTSSGSTSTTRTRPSRTRPARPAPTTNDAALVAVGDQGRAQGAALLLPARGAGLRQRTSSTSPRPRAAGPPRTTPTTTTPTGSVAGNGQVWAYHCRSQKLQVLYQAPVDPVEANRRFDFPDNITTSAPRDARRLRGQHRRQLHPRPVPRRTALGHRAQPAGQPADRRCRGSATSSPGRRSRPDGHTLFVNIQASKGLTFAIWGPWKKIGV